MEMMPVNKLLINVLNVTNVTLHFRVYKFLAKYFGVSIYSHIIKKLEKLSIVSLFRVFTLSDISNIKVNCSGNIYDITVNANHIKLVVFTEDDKDTKEGDIYFELFIDLTDNNFKVLPSETCHYMLEYLIELPEDVELDDFYKRKYMSYGETFIRSAFTHSFGAILSKNLNINNFKEFEKIINLEYKKE